MKETMSTSVTTLLDIVSHVEQKHIEVAKLTGRDFNLIQILGLTKDEVRLHSRLLAELLSPKGKHGQGDIYLKLFLKQLNEKSFTSEENKVSSDLKTESVRVEVERYIGKKTKTTGGRIDLICEDTQGNRVIIENKIHAPDQENQLLRYYNYDQEATLIYLTLFGTKPPKFSTGSGKDDEAPKVICLSYESDIIEWLLECIKHSHSLSSVRESMLQYMNTIRSLTNQIENIDMDKEVVEAVVSNGNRFSGALLVQRSIREAKLVLLKRLGKKLYELLSDKYDAPIKVELNEKFGEKYKGIKVFPPQTEIVWFQLMFFNDNSDIYLEIQNKGNWEKGKGKNISNIEYYRKQLNEGCGPLGKMPDVSKNWQGDWVCNYLKLDEFFESQNGWSELADNDLSICNTIVEEVSPIIEAMLARVRVIWCPMEE